AAHDEPPVTSRIPSPADTRLEVVRIRSPVSADVLIQPRPDRVGEQLPVVIVQSKIEIDVVPKTEIDRDPPVNSPVVLGKDAGLTRSIRHDGGLLLTECNRPRAPV